MELNRNEVISLYKKIKYFAKKEYLRNDIDSSLKNISLAANVAYKLNFIYKDDELESLLYEIAKKVITKSPAESNQLNSNKYVFIDALGYPNKGLTQQYLRGLMSMNVEILYISEYVEPSKRLIYDEIEQYTHGSLCLVPNSSYIDKIKFIYTQIVDYKPKVILSHLTPWDVVATTVLYALPEIKRYNINLTDHAFWLGAGCFDYLFEFRNFGATVSEDKREFKSQQILINPFYPIIDETPFLGFPKEVKDKVILFSGGDYYKIYGNNNKFLVMMKCILENNQDSILLFAGKGLNKKPVVDFIINNDLTNRFIIIDERSDINQVFAHSDIYLGTYPLSGGLMTQFAAYNSKPVVAYAEPNTTINNVEDLIFNSGAEEVQITYTNIDEYYNEVQKLIQDGLYREEKGRYLKQALRTVEGFNFKLRDLLQNGEKSHYIHLKIEYENIFEHYLSLNNKITPDLGILLFKNFKILTFFYFFKVSIKYFIKVMEFFVKQKLIRKKRK